jgi:cbb3-type cytochrome oxidase subunit 3
MWLIFVEALAALLILIFIVWWTMFSGRKRGERDDTPDRDDTPRR